MKAVVTHIAMWLLAIALSGVICMAPLLDQIDQQRHEATK